MHSLEVIALIKAAYMDGLSTGYHEGMSLSYAEKSLTTQALMDEEWKFSDTFDLLEDSK